MKMLHTALLPLTVLSLGVVANGAHAAEPDMKALMLRGHEKMAAIPAKVMATPPIQSSGCRPDVVYCPKPEDGDAQFRHEPVPHATSLQA